MPKFTTDTEDVVIAAHFGFSAARPDVLDETEYTLVTIAVDVSGSVHSFQNDLEKCLKDAVAACHRSPRANNVLLRIILFSTQVREICGFVPLNDVHPDQLTGTIQPSGTTALYEACENAVRASHAQTERLRKDDIDSNCLMIVITDGENYMPYADKSSESAVAKAMRDAVADEQIGSLTTILVAINAGGSAASLKRFNDAVGFTQFVDAGDVSPAKLAKLAEFISKSTSTVSQAIGSGSSPVSITF